MHAGRAQSCCLACIFVPFPVCQWHFLILFCHYLRYKDEKLMEHLKLFSTRINIPRLIRVCEEFHHWKELVFLYVQYDEYDNAAMVMMNHSPVAWEHVLFKDVAVKVSSVEVYYKAISFYLEEHPDLLNDLLKVSRLLLMLPPWLSSCVTLMRLASCSNMCHHGRFLLVHMQLWLARAAQVQPHLRLSCSPADSWICACQNTFGCHRAT